MAIDRPLAALADMDSGWDDEPDLARATALTDDPVWKPDVPKTYKELLKEVKTWRLTKN